MYFLKQDDSLPIDNHKVLIPASMIKSSVRVKKAPVSSLEPTIICEAWIKSLLELLSQVGTLNYQNRHTGCCSSLVGVVLVEYDWTCKF